MTFEDAEIVIKWIPADEIHVFPGGINGIPETGPGEIKLAELLRYNLKSVRAYLLKEDFDAFWNYLSPAWAGKFLDRWCTRAMRSRLDPMKKVAHMLRSHRELLLNWFAARDAISAGATEGNNNTLKVITRRAYGFKAFKVLETTLFHTMGDLPQPKATHRFCG